MANILLLGARLRREFAYKTIFNRKDKLIVVDTPKITEHQFFSIADYVIMINPNNTKKIIKAIDDIHLSIDGVITFEEEYVPVVSELCKILGLVGNSIEASFLSTNKKAMRDSFTRANLPVPVYKLIRNKEQAVSFVHEVGFPVIVKPINSSGSIGVTKVCNEDQLLFSYDLAKKYSKNVLIEEFIDGPEFYVNSAFYQGKHIISFVSDRVQQSDSPYFVEYGSDEPTLLPQDEQNNIIEMTKAGVLSLGIENGLTHTEIKLSKAGPILIEIASRAGGGNQIDLIYLSTGINLYDIAIDICWGKEPKVKYPENRRGCSIRELASEGGEIHDVLGLDSSLKKIKGIVDFLIYVPPGFKAKKPTSNSDIFGYFIITAKNSRISKKNSQLLLDSIIFSTDKGFQKPFY